MLGELSVMLLKILMRTRKSVTSKDILPGTISGGTKKLTYHSINVYQSQETEFEYKSLFDYN